MKISVFITIIFLCGYSLYSQCGCMGGAAVGGLTPLGGSANLGVLKENNLRTSVFFMNGYGNKYYSGDIITEPGLVKEYKFNYIGFNAGYGLTEDLTLELESGYFLQKMQDYYYSKLESSGFSHLNTSVKYNLYNSRVKELEYTAGIGARVPVNFSEANVPQNILPSTGAYGILFHSFLHKGFKNEGLHLFLINRAEINAINKHDYLYGYSIFSSFYISKSIFNNLVGILELRNEYRGKDRYNGSIIEDSGGLVFVASPQLSYKIDNFYISCNYDYPFYKYYNGKQLTNSYSFGIMLTWQINLDS